MDDDDDVIFCLGHVCFAYRSGVNTSVYTVFIMLSILFVPMLCILSVCVCMYIDQNTGKLKDSLVFMVVVLLMNLRFT